MPERKGWQREELQALRREYAEQLGDRLRGIEEAVIALGEAWNAEEVESLYHQIHRLGGSAAIYGFADLSQTAQAFEAALLDLKERPRAPARFPEELARLVKALRRAARESRT